MEVGVVVQCVVSPPGEDPGARGAGLATLRTLAARSPRQVLMPLLTMGSRLDASALHTANRALNQVSFAFIVGCPGSDRGDAE